MVKGVFKFDDHNRKRPYYIWKTINKKKRRFCFDTKDEAVKAREEYQQEKEDVQRKKFEQLVPKRIADVAAYGNNSALERDVALELVAAWTDMTGQSAHVLNDGTRGDLIFEREDGRFLVVQLKTTERKSKNPRAYKFTAVCGYTGMPVLCVCSTEKIGWVIDGGVLDERGKPQIEITPDAMLEKAVARAKGSLRDLLVHLTAHIDDWGSSTEDEARHDFLSKTHAKEMRGIDAYKRRFQDSTYEWPVEQGGHVDLVIDGRRAQFKTARTMSSKAGFRLNLKTRAGKDEGGKQLMKPYSHDAFDDLIVAWEEQEGGQWYFWRIPATELTKRGHLSTPTQWGTNDMCVHGPTGVGKQPDSSAKKKADTWTKNYFLAEQ